MFAPAMPPELSAQTPGIDLNKSAVLCGEIWAMSSAAIVVTAKLAACRSVPRPPGVPAVTMISSSGSPSGVVGASWATAGSDMSTASPKTPGCHV